MKGSDKEEEEEEGEGEEAGRRTMRGGRPAQVVGSGYSARLHTMYNTYLSVENRNRGRRVLRFHRIPIA